MCQMKLNVPNNDNDPDRDRRVIEFMNLLVPNQRKIFAFILGMVPNKADAEDIQQETLVKMWSNFDRFEIGTDFVAWGVTIAKYRIFEFRRKRKGSKLQFSEELLQTFVAESEQRMPFHLDMLRKCMQKLTQKEVDFLKLRYGCDLTLKRIAERTGITIPAVHKAISLIHNRLARCVRLSLYQDE